MRERADNQPLASGSGANPLVNLPDPKVIKIDKDLQGLTPCLTGGSCISTAFVREMLLVDKIEA
jgi:hypothetical protein